MKTRNAILWFFCFLNSYFLILTSASAQDVPSGRSGFLNAFNAPDKVTLYSIEPYSVLPTADDKGFRGYVISKSIALDKSEFKEALGAISNSILKWATGSSRCFEPHHAMRIVAKGKTYDLVICFECGYMTVDGDNGYHDECLLQDKPDSLDRLLLIERAPNVILPLAIAMVPTVAVGFGLGRYVVKKRKMKFQP